MLRQLTAIPDGLLDARAHQLYRMLGGPTVIHLAGRRDPPAFISVLQHGNEDGGWEAIRRWLKHHGDDMPRSLILFIANVEAARAGLRRLDYQPDFNRSWPGAPKAATALHRALAELTDEMRAIGPFVSIDLHNNSGENPPYGGINRLDPQWLYLASQFSPSAIYFRVPKGAQSIAFSAFCPAITLELGKPGNQQAIDQCEAFIEHCMNLEAIPDDFHPDDSFEIYQTFARASITPEIDFCFDDSTECHVRFRSDIESLNFLTVETGTELATVHAQGPLPVFAMGENGDDVTTDYFVSVAGRLKVARPFVASMFSTDRRVVRQDCLCYLMERIDVGPNRMTPIFKT